MIAHWRLGAEEIVEGYHGYNIVYCGKNYYGAPQFQSGTSYNIILWGKRFYGVPQALGNLDIRKELGRFSKEIIAGDSLEEIKGKINHAGHFKTIQNLIRDLKTTN